MLQDFKYNIMSYLIAKKNIANSVIKEGEKNST